MEAPARIPQTRLHGLDALRGIAAFCVLGLHAHAVFGGFPDWFGKGYLAVDFFFMLSGYLMSRVYEARFAAGLAPLRFLRARYRRIWPTMAVGALLGAPYLWSHTGHIGLFAPLFAANLALLPVAFERELFPLNVPAWSVFFELVANYAHGLGLWRLRKFALAAIIALALGLTMMAGSQHGDIDLGARPETFVTGFSRAMLSYLIGVALWQLWGERPWLHIPPIIAVLAFPTILVVAWWFALDGWRWDIAFVVLICPLLLAGGLAMDRPSKLAMAIGEASFPLYAVHFACLRLASLYGYGVGFGVTGALVMTVVVAAASARLRKSH